MPRITFSRERLKGLKPTGTDKTVDYFDEDYSSMGSLYVRMPPSGRATINVQFRLKEEDGGGQTKRKIGYLADWLASGANVTKLRNYAAAAISAGREAGMPRRVQKQVEKTSQVVQASQGDQTIAVAGKLYLEHRQRKGARDYTGRNARSNRRRLERVIERATKVWGGTRLDQLTQNDAVELVLYTLSLPGKKEKDEKGEKEGKSGAPAAAEAVVGLLPQVLRHARNVFRNRDIDVDIFRGIWSQVDKKAFERDDRAPILRTWDREKFFAALREYQEADGEPERLYTLKERKEKPVKKRDVANKCDALRWLYLAGCRSQEVLYATWGEIDLERGVWNMPDANRKNGYFQMFLPSAVIQVIERVKRRANATGDDDRVFPFSKTTLRDVFKDVLLLAGIDQGFRMHDLRAMRATQRVLEDKMSEIEYGQVIGSADVKTLVKHYLHDTAKEERRRERVNSPGDAALV